MALKRNGILSNRVPPALNLAKTRVTVSIFAKLTRQPGENRAISLTFRRVDGALGGYRGILEEAFSL